MIKILLVFVVFLLPLDAHAAAQQCGAGAHWGTVSCPGTVISIPGYTVPFCQAGTGYWMTQGCIPNVTSCPSGQFFANKSCFPTPVSACNSYNFSTPTDIQTGTSSGASSCIVKFCYSGAGQTVCTTTIYNLDTTAPASGVPATTPSSGVPATTPSASGVPSTTPASGTPGTGTGTTPGTGIGTGTGTGTGIGTTPGSGVAPTPDPCTLNPGLISCATLGTPPAPETIPTAAPDFTPSVLAFAGASGCPAPFTFTLTMPGIAGTYSISVQPLCDLAVLVRPIFIALATISSLFIFVGVVI